MILDQPKGLRQIRLSIELTFDNSENAEEAYSDVAGGDVVDGFRASLTRSKVIELEILTKDCDDPEAYLDKIMNTVDEFVR